ncbi:MAG: 6-carboxytetrahydropterin synthase QueD [Eggerthellaceae bacterium]|jgi:6-pyruvoyltetrahydropterin/6-carboxytetrahydropterin synthase
MSQSPQMTFNPPYDGDHRLSGRKYTSGGGHYEVSIKDHFDAAHSLPGYDGQCQYLHGHTWDVELTVVGGSLDKVGLLCDFKMLKDELHAILDNFDHHYINQIPPFNSINPTAENLARIIFYELEGRIPNTVTLKEVSVWESPYAKVTYRP